jgi:hypothetical protein
LRAEPFDKLRTALVEAPAVPFDRLRAQMRAEPFDKLRTALVEAQPVSFDRLRTHSPAPASDSVERDDGPR